MKSTKIVGFQSGHDVSYCILENGVPTLVEEWERISRKKMQLGDGLKFFFSRNQDFSDIKYFTSGNFKGTIGKWESVLKNRRSQQLMRIILAKNKGKYYEFGHHLSHAANAFYTSDFEKALIVTIDGGGWENVNLRTGFTISEGTGNKITPIKIFPINEVNIGVMWHALTGNLFGLSVGYPKGDQAGTVMAMASLGQPKYVSFMENFGVRYLQKLEDLKRIVNLSEQEKFNVAASLQAYSELVVRNILSKYVSGHKNLCFSGGVSLNCVMLAKVNKWFPEIKNIFCDPIPYDAGLSIGSARYLWHHVLGNPRIKIKSNMSPYLGKQYSKKDIKKILKLFSSKIKVTNSNDEDLLNKINQQKIVSIFGGRSEIGRRALGNRSILADPRAIQIKDKINQKVKHREWFRPFAPSILEEKLKDWFENPNLSPYMSFALMFKKSKRKKIPAVVHFDGTGRVQTVNKALNPYFHSLLVKWEKISGVPILLNTSFNDSEPIVETPEDALKCFLATDLDYLYFFDYGYLVEKL